MNSRLFFLFLLMLFGVATTSNAKDTALINPFDPLPLPLLSGDFEQYGYYTFRQDFRKCASPMCGGIFVKSVNHKVTRCADGSFRTECYLGTVDNRSNIPLKQVALLRGFIRPTVFGGFGSFVLKSAFKPASLQPGQGQFVGLENNGLFCITSPCFSYNQYVLNSDVNRVISGLDLQAVKANEKVLQLAWDRLANGQVLIAAGYNKKVRELAGVGITFVANQVYLPIKSGAK